MIYKSTITTPANTAKTSPKDTEVKVVKGLVYGIDILFPSGSEGLMGCRIMDGAFQIWPTSIDEWFIGDDIYFQYDDLYVKETEPFQFNIETYNLDDTYEHMVIVGISMVSREIFKARFLPTLAYREFQDMMERILRQQEEAKAIRKYPLPIKPPEGAE